MIRAGWGKNLGKKKYPGITISDPHKFQLMQKTIDLVNLKRGNIYQRQYNQYMYIILSNIFQGRRKTSVNENEYLNDHRFQYSVCKMLTHIPYYSTKLKATFKDTSDSHMMIRAGNTAYNNASVNI